LPRALWAFVCLLPARKRLNAVPQGDGRPVMLLPGLFNSDMSMTILRRYLRQIGYNALGWELGRNLGSRAIGEDGDRLMARLDAIYRESGQPVTLVGVSLGGIMARFAAHRAPHQVREVITVASPYVGDPRDTNVWRAFEVLTGERIDSASVVERRTEIARPLPVPATAIWSRSDGLVNGFTCHALDEPGLKSIEVTSSHMGVQWRPEVLTTIADVLGGRRDGPVQTQ
jgi:pimeloyl-ACP methyl ester carboxylesterase